MRTVQIISMLVLSASVAGAAPTALQKAESNVKANIRAQIRAQASPQYRKNPVQVSLQGTPVLDGKRLATPVPFFVSFKEGLVSDGTGTYQYGKHIVLE